jgi:hypothetical protein
MTDVTRRQVGIGALSMIAAPLFPAPIAKALAAMEAGGECEFAQGQLMRDTAQAFAEFCKADRDFFNDPNARASWNLAHHELAQLTQLLRIDPIGDIETKQMIRSWIDTLYPSPRIRAWHVPKPLTDLSRAFAEHQAELDAMTLKLGEADYLFAQYKRQSGARYGSKRYADLWASVGRELRKQDALSASFSFLRVDTPDDKTAALRAAMTYNGCYTVRSLNARRTWWIRSHARS